MSELKGWRGVSMPWYGELPERWESVKLRQVLQERKEKNTGIKCSNILSVIRNRGVILYADKGNVGNKHSEDIERYNVVHINDIVMNSMNVIIGSVGRSDYYGVLSPVYYVLRVMDTERNNVRYLDYIFQMTMLQRDLTKLGNGILAHRMRIPIDKLKNIELPLPPRDEQDQIVCYLDWKVSQINMLINAKRRQIALLQEQKRALISLQLRGEPVWLKRLISFPFQYGANDSGVDFSPELPRYVRITDISQDGKLKNEGAKSLSREVAEPYILSDGDILFARSGATVGKSFLYKSEYGLCAFAGYLIRAKTDTTRLLPEYLMYVTNSSDYEQWKNSVFILATIQNISAERYGQLPVPIPSLAEQQTIVEYLDQQCSRIDKIISKLNDELALFAEYRTRLISDVVTGKLDVRGVVVPEYEALEDAADNITEDEKPHETEEE